MTCDSHILLNRWYLDSRDFLIGRHLVVIECRLIAGIVVRKLVMAGYI